MSDGEVWVTLVQVMVVLTTVPDTPLTLMTDGYGLAMASSLIMMGAVFSKWPSNCPACSQRLPCRCSWQRYSPHLSSRKVATICWPLVPCTVKVNYPGHRVAMVIQPRRNPVSARPDDEIGGRRNDAVGGEQGGFDMSAALLPPASRRANRMVTVSFESITPLGAPAPVSETIAEPAEPRNCRCCRGW